MSNPQGKEYLLALYEVYNNYDYESPRTGEGVNDGGYREKLNYHITVRYPTREPVIIGHPRDITVIGYSNKERVLFDEGNIYDLHTISKFWSKIKNPDGSNNANYGYMVYHLKDAGNAEFGNEFQSQWDWAKSRLIRKKDTAQAYLHFNRMKDQWKNNLDQPCVMFGQFIIRDGELHMTVSMRSNDLIFGTPYNWAYFIELMYRMCDELQERYPGLRIGHFHHFATSLHIYDKHYILVEDILRLDIARAQFVSDSQRLISTNTNSTTGCHRHG